MRILVVGTMASIHTGRFVALLKDLGHEVRVFNQSADYAEEEHLRGVSAYVSEVRPSKNGNTLRAWPHNWRSQLGQFAWRVCNRRHPEPIEAFHAWFREDVRQSARFLANVLAEWPPELVISLKMQNEGYTVARAKANARGTFPPWLHFNWGTDIVYFGLRPEMRDRHLSQVEAVLRSCDFHIADCLRDAGLARELGFRGKSLGACLANGGFDLARMAEIRRQHRGERRQILVKGRQWPPVSVGMNVLRSLDQVKAQLDGYRVRFIMCTPDVEAAVRAAAAEGAPYEVLPRLPYDELLGEFARSRFTIAATNVDGTPLFLAETIVTGSVPVHSDLASVREWVVDERNGLLFDPANVPALSARISRALQDDAFIAEASRQNLAIAEARMDRARIGQHVQSLLEQMVGRTVAAPPRGAGTAHVTSTSRESAQV